MTGEPTTLLVVDDDDIAVMAVRRAAASLNIDMPTLHARDGQEALEMLRNSHVQSVASPYVVLLDINMPRMSGLEFLAELRRDPQLSGSVVLVMSTSDAPADISASYDLHVAGYIVKTSGQTMLRKLFQMLENYTAIVTPFPDTRT